MYLCVVKPGSDSLRMALVNEMVELLYVEELLC